MLWASVLLWHWALTGQCHAPDRRFSSWAYYIWDRRGGFLSHNKHQHILPVLQTAVCLPGEPFPQTSYIHFSFTLMRRLLSTHWFSGCPLTACQASLYTKYLEYANDQVKIEATCLDVTFYSHLTPFLKRSQMLQNENCTFLVNTERMIYADRHSLAICHR